MCNLRNEIRQLLEVDHTIESLDNLSEKQKRLLTVESLNDKVNFDHADILLYRNETFKAITQKFIDKQLTGEQFANRVIEMLVDGVKSTIDEMISEEREELAEQFSHSHNIFAQFRAKEMRGI